MCGVAGIMTSAGAPPVQFDELRRMVAMLTHRGPDGYGLYRDDRVGLGHARLSIIDLEGGAQPLSNADGTLWLTFNGEIFNYIELRRQLVDLGHRFLTKSDSEVIVNCYERYGARAWEMLNGQFAFALWDSRTRKLWLVRDRIGILPLHYALVDGHLVFASEAKALFAGGRIAPRLDPEGLSQIFTTWSVPPPRSAFAGVRQVPVATAICFDANLRATEQRYWRLHPAPVRRALGQAAEELEGYLQRSVDLRLRADVPVGAYISGGIDSSVVGSLAVQRSRMIQTFGIRFEDPRFDETKEQRLVVNHLKTDHHEVYCKAGDIRASLADTIWHCEMPLTRTAPVPLFLLSGAVRAAGTKTVLTGEGADEFLCGYTIFKEDQIRRFWARRPDSQMRPALLRRIHHYVGGEDAHKNALWQRFFKSGLTETDQPFYSHMIRWQNTAWTLRFLTPEIRASLPLEAMLAELEEGLPADWRQWDPLTRAQYIEINWFLSSYLLAAQGDRVAMAHGVEARYPFLDPEFVDFSFTLEPSDKMLGTRDKLALRRLARSYLPPEIWNRRKQPYRAPISSALFGEHAAEFQDLLSPAALGRDGHFDVAAVGQLIARTERRGSDLFGEREEMAFTGILTLRMLDEAYGAGFAGRAREARERLANMECHVLVDHATEGSGAPQGRA